MTYTTLPVVSVRASQKLGGTPTFSGDNFGREEEDEEATKEALLGTLVEVSSVVVLETFVVAVSVVFAVSVDVTVEVKEVADVADVEIGAAEVEVSGIVLTVGSISKAEAVKAESVAPLDDSTDANVAGASTCDFLSAAMSALLDE